MKKKTKDQRPQTTDIGTIKKNKNLQFSPRSSISGFIPLCFNQWFRFFVFGLGSLVFGLWSKDCYACPMCSDLIERGKDALAAMRFGKGIAWSMGLMFAMPVLLVGGFALVILRESRKSKYAAPHESKP